jgi:hypothetical protein
LGLATKDSTAIRVLRRAIALDPSRADVRIWLATPLTRAAHYDEALQLSRDAAAIEPLWPMPLYDLVVRLAVNGQMAQARQLAAQYRSRGGNEAQYHRLLFAIETRGPDISSAIAEGNKALALDATLPSIRGDLMGLYYLVGLEQQAPKDMPSAVRLAAPFLRGDTSALQSQIQSAGVRLWNLPDSGFGFFHLAAVHDWTTLTRLYDLRPMPPQQLCFRYLAATQALVPALRAAGRRGDAESLQRCLHDRLAIEARQKSRYWYAYSGDYEYEQATLAALSGNRVVAVHWLEQAVSQGWLGRPYSPSISDRPQFDALRSDSRLAALQGRINQTIARERAEVLAKQHRSEPAFSAVPTGA